MPLLSRSNSAHPVPEVLALYSRGDLPLMVRLRLKAHLTECASCEQQVALFGSAVRELKREAATETLTAFEAVVDWNHLEREMLGNIVVGVAAARCIEKVGHKPTWVPKVALGAGLAVLFAAGWVTHIPPEQSGHLAASLSRLIGLEEKPKLLNFVEATPSGIAVRSQGVTLTILHPSTALISLSGSSSMEARYIDEDTGQVTITNVYGQ